MTQTKSKSKKTADLMERKQVQLPLRVNYHQKARELARAKAMYPGLFMAQLLEDAIDYYESIKIVPNPIAQRN